MRQGQRLTTGAGDAAHAAARGPHVAGSASRAASWPLFPTRWRTSTSARLERSLTRLVGFIGPAAVVFISILIGGMIVSIMSTLMSFNEMIG